MGHLEAYDSGDEPNVGPHTDGMGCPGEYGTDVWTAWVVRLAVVVRFLEVVEVVRGIFVVKDRFGFEFAFKTF